MCGMMCLWSSCNNSNSSKEQNWGNNNNNNNNNTSSLMTAPCSSICHGCCCCCSCCWVGLGLTKFAFNSKFFSYRNPFSESKIYLTCQFVGVFFFFFFLLNFEAVHLDEWNCNCLNLWAFLLKSVGICNKPYFLASNMYTAIVSLQTSF